MRRTLLLAVVTLSVVAGTAAADHRYRGHDRHDRRDRIERRHDNRVDVRDHRGWDRDRNWDRRRVVRDDYRRNIDRRPIYVRDNRFTFSNGRTFHYHRPVINVRYTDYRYRPRLLVENYDVVPGYLWVSGSWGWNGYEWYWTPGYYQVDPNYSYDDAYYYSSPVADHDCY